MNKVQISQRKLKAYQAAEELCRLIRTRATTPCDIRWPYTDNEMKLFSKLLLNWLDKADKHKFDKPKGWPL